MPAKFLRLFVYILEPIIQIGIESGEFDPGNARQFALAIGAMMEGTLLLWAYDPDSMQVEEQLRLGAELLLKGLKTP